MIADKGRHVDWTQSRPRTPHTRHAQGKPKSGRETGRQTQDRGQSCTEQGHAFGRGYQVVFPWGIYVFLSVLGWGKRGKFLVGGSVFVSVPPLEEKWELEEGRGKKGGCDL